MARIQTGIFAGRESLISHGSALSNIADNIANSNTAGFKSSRLEFGDLLAESVGSLYGAPVTTGNGVRTEEQTTFHSVQGALEFTGRELDVAIQGQGYFVLNDGTNQKYTRAGNFVTDVNGNLRAVSGEAVLGFTAESPEAPVPLTLAAINADAQATTFIDITGNLAADDPEIAAADIPGAPANFAELNEATTYRSAARMVDSLGREQDVSIHYFHTGPGEWLIRAYVDGGQVNGEPGVPVQVGEAQLAFDATGQLQNPEQAVLNVNAAWADAEPGVTAITFNMTGFAGTSNVSGINADGLVAGDVESLRFQPDGTILAILSNGGEATIGQLAVASFNNPNGLQRVGANQFLSTDKSGDVTIGRANQEGFGTINGGALESSIVDPASEFVSMIRFQRGYQASSSVIQTLDRILEQTIQIA